jgi:hypothetical protein
MHRCRKYFISLAIAIISFLFAGTVYADDSNSQQKKDSNNKKDVTGEKSGDMLADTPYYLETFEVQKKENIHISSFFFVNHFFLHVLSNFGLLERLKQDEVEYIVEEMLKDLSLKEPINFVFNNFKNGKKLAISLSVVTKEKNNYLLILTNYDSKKRDVLPLETPRDQRKDCFSSIYFIAPNKLVSENHFYSKEIEDELKKAGNLSNLADFYIFDEKTDNDSLIEELLTKAYSVAKKPEDKFQNSILFSLYYLMVDKADLAITALDNAKAVLDADIKNNKKNLAQALDVQYQELRLIQKLKTDGFN